NGKQVDEGLSVKKRLPVLERELSTSRQQIAEQGELLAELKADLASSNESRAQAVTATAQLQNEIDRLKAEIAGMDETNLMGWFVRGGAVALAGLIIGLIVPHLPKRRRRSDDWF
ncbi:MAG TPA: TIGR04211 family SH3 domain-containing protein, partial [Motiliproteus sp.]